MNDDMTPIPAVLEDVKREIWEGDLIILRNRKGRAVRAMKAARWDDEVFAVEVRKFEGVVAVPLEQLVRLYPGRVDVYEVNPQDLWPDYDRQGATRHLKSVVFSEADRRNLIVEILLNLVSRWFGATNEKIVKTPCGAEAIRMADRLGGGVEPLPDLANVRIKPADLEQSPLYSYRFTLR